MYSRKYSTIKQLHCHTWRKSVIFLCKHSFRLRHFFSKNHYIIHCFTTIVSLIFENCVSTLSRSATATKALSCLFVLEQDNAAFKPAWKHIKLNTGLNVEAKHVFWFLGGFFRLKQIRVHFETGVWVYLPPLVWYSADENSMQMHMDEAGQRGRRGWMERRIASSEMRKTSTTFFISAVTMWS